MFSYLVHIRAINGDYGIIDDSHVVDVENLVTNAASFHNLVIETGHQYRETHTNNSSIKVLSFVLITSEKEGINSVNPSLIELTQSDFLKDGSTIRVYINIHDNVQFFLRWNNEESVFVNIATDTRFSLEEVFDMKGSKLYYVKND